MDQNKEKQEVEIDFLELAKKLWDNKKFIIKCSIIGAVVGLVIAFSIPKEYTSTVILTTGSGESAKGNMGALASIAGINLGNVNNEMFSPELYPEILNSTPFIQGLLDVLVSDPNQEINTSLYLYFENKKNPWWQYLFMIPSKTMSLLTNNKEMSLDIISENKFFISHQEMKVIEFVKESYNINTNTKTGITTINVTTQSPFISAQLADTLTLYLQKYIIEQRTKKANIDLENSERLYQQAKEEYYIAQRNLASFSDENFNIVSNKFLVHKEKLQNEAKTIYTIYHQMAQQVQMDRVKVQNNTPVFTIIQPPFQPLGSSSPKKKILLIVYIFISFVGASIYILRKDINDFIRA